MLLLETMITEKSYDYLKSLTFDKWLVKLDKIVKFAILKIKFNKQVVWEVLDHYINRLSSKKCIWLK